MMVGILACLIEKKWYQLVIPILITTQEDHGHLLFFRLNQAVQRFYMRFKHHQVKKFFLQVEDIGLVAKALLKNGKPIIGFGLDLMAMGRQGRKHFYQKYSLV